MSLTKKKRIRTVPAGIAHVKATFNNTIVTITDPAGDVIGSSSAGAVGLTGHRKSAAYGALSAAMEAVKKAVALGLREVEVEVQGPGAGREAAVRGLQTQGVIVTKVKDVTPVPHNGCKARKRRRV